MYNPRQGKKDILTATTDTETLRYTLPPEVLLSPLRRTSLYDTLAMLREMTEEARAIEDPTQRRMAMDGLDAAARNIPFSFEPERKS